MERKNYCSVEIKRHSIEKFDFTKNKYWTMKITIKSFFLLTSYPAVAIRHFVDKVVATFFLKFKLAGLRILKLNSSASLMYIEATSLLK